VRAFDKNRMNGSAIAGNDAFQRLSQNLHPGGRASSRAQTSARILGNQGSRGRSPSPACGCGTVPPPRSTPQAPAVKHTSRKPRTCDEQLAAAADLNAAEWLRLQGRLPSVESHDDGETLRVFAGDTYPRNSVAFARFTPANGSRRVGEILQSHLLQRAACNWVVGPVTLYRDLAKFQEVLRQSPTNAVALRYTQALRSPAAGTRTPARQPTPPHIFSWKPEGTFLCN